MSICSPKVAHDHSEFNFYDAHDLGSDLTDPAAEETMKRRLRKGFSSSQIGYSLDWRTDEIRLSRPLEGTGGLLESGTVYHPRQSERQADLRFRKLSTHHSLSVH